MELVFQSQAFGLNYVAYDQNAGLFVAFNVYDVTTGTAIFIQKVVGTYSAFGLYTADYTGSTLSTYLVIGVVYTDNTYASIDPNRSPGTSVYQVLGSNVTFLGFSYGAYDQNAGLFVRGTVYNLSTGSPVFVQNINMTYVAFGTYFGSYVGTVGQTYQIAEVVYTSGTYSTPDLNRSPGAEGFDCFTVPSGGGVTNTIVSATLIGQSLFDAILTGQTLTATLTET